MKIVQINTVYGRGSTGKICLSISEILDRNGVENYILFSSGRCDYSNAITCCSGVYTKFQALKSRILGNYGFNSQKETRKMMSMLDQIQPDIVHLHNIHGHDCHLEVLADYLKEKKIKVFWTFHDCWTFTGYCTYFDLVACDKWKTGCGNCPQKNKYSWLFDRSAELHQRKQKAFSGLDLTIITPSQWLADLVTKSFLAAYPVKVIHNGIDLNIFKPTPSDFRKKFNIPDSKSVLLGVAFGWGVRKGIDVFIELSKRLDPKKYQIVLVGTDEKIDRQLPEKIISIHRTNNQSELAEIYSAADLFVNPTREEVLGMVNLEAQACGTPVITFRTGGSPETLTEKTGVIVACDDIDALEQSILRIWKEKPFSQLELTTHAKMFDDAACYQEYLKLYSEK